MKLPRQHYLQGITLHGSRSDSLGGPRNSTYSLCDRQWLSACSAGGSTKTYSNSGCNGNYDRLGRTRIVDRDEETATVESMMIAKPTFRALPFMDRVGQDVLKSYSCRNRTHTTKQQFSLYPTQVRSTRTCTRNPQRSKEV